MEHRRECGLQTTRKVGELPHIKHPWNLLKDESTKSSRDVFQNKLNQLVSWFGKVWVNLSLYLFTRGLYTRVSP